MVDTVRNTQEVVEVGHTRSAQVQNTQEVAEVGYRLSNSAVYDTQEVVEVGHILVPKVFDFQEVIEVGFIATVVAAGRYYGLAVGNG
jgi:hypothetical protein